MSKRNLIIIAVVLVVFALGIQFFSSSKNSRRDSRIGVTLVDSDIVESIEEIVIEKDTAALHLQKQDNLWRIKEKNGYPANVKDILTLIQNITSYKVASIVTENPNRLAYFKLLNKSESGDKSSQGSLLTFKSGDKPIFELLVGKHRDSIDKGSDAPAYPDGTYVRLGDSKSVFLIKENLDLNADAGTWMQKQLAIIEEEQIKAVRYETQNDKTKPYTKYINSL